MTSTFICSHDCIGYLEQKNYVLDQHRIFVNKGNDEFKNSIEFILSALYSETRVVIYRVTQ